MGLSHEMTTVFRKVFSIWYIKIFTALLRNSIGKILLLSLKSLTNTKIYKASLFRTVKGPCLKYKTKFAESRL